MLFLDVRTGDLWETSTEAIKAPSPVYEAWQPKLGQRVRTKLSPECQGYPAFVRATGGIKPHGYPEWDEIIGTVVRMSDPDGRGYYESGHRYLVIYDDKPRDSLYGNLIDGDYYAANELEPVR